MKCSDCGGSLNSGEVVLECRACAMFLYDCTCKRTLGYLPERIAHCLNCQDFYRATIDTTDPGWRSRKI